MGECRELGPRQFALDGSTEHVPRRAGLGVDDDRSTIVSRRRRERQTATVEFGIGGIPQAVVEFLKDKQDLGIHTEMFSDGVVELFESGVVTGEAKPLMIYSDKEKGSKSKSKSGDSAASA